MRGRIENLERSNVGPRVSTIDKSMAVGRKVIDVMNFDRVAGNLTFPDSQLVLFRQLLFL